MILLLVGVIVAGTIGVAKLSEAMRHESFRAKHDSAEYISGLYQHTAAWINRNGQPDKQYQDAKEHYDRIMEAR